MLGRGLWELQEHHDLLWVGHVVGYRLALAHVVDLYPLMEQMGVL